MKKMTCFHKKTVAEYRRAKQKSRRRGTPGREENRKTALSNRILRYKHINMVCLQSRFIK
ncbi:hypothetical protein JCM10003_1252 [Bacteroides pyogenes JCM 10003]|nr:hypothetical protein JCM10003_1252 [Bacteroides pyogenes JCM 10003]